MWYLLLFRLRKEKHINHGRTSAKIAREFLEDFEMSDDRVNEICYSIAIHVDNKSDFQWEPISFSQVVSDADNIVRFDAYRIYETLQHNKYDEKSSTDKKTFVEESLKRLNKYLDMPFGTKTATQLWKTRLEFYISYYGRLQDQLLFSRKIV